MSLVAQRFGLRVVCSIALAALPHLLQADSGLGVKLHASGVIDNHGLVARKVVRVGERLGHQLGARAARLGDAQAVFLLRSWPAVDRVALRARYGFRVGNRAAVELFEIHV